jgi:hypothetical protein
MQRFSPSLLAAAGLLLTGCLINNMSAGERLKDSVVGLNDEIRWARIDLAVQRVHPEFKAEYVANHHAWGENIQIADMDLLNMQLDDDMDAAMSVVAVSWYRYETMTIHRTVVQQKWELVSRSFVLRDERVLSGDPDLLAPPDEPEPEPDSPDDTLARAAP